MQVPKQIIQFAADVRNKTSDLTELVAKYNDLLGKKQKISEIPKEYLNVQPIGDPELTRKLIMDGIGVESARLDAQIKDKIDEIYSIADNCVHNQQ